MLRLILLLLSVVVLAGPAMPRHSIEDNIYRIYCFDGSMGTAVRVNKNMLLTANHVIKTDNYCVAESPHNQGISFVVPLMHDPKNDNAILYIENEKETPKISCDGYKTGEIYRAIGWADGIRLEMIYVVATEEFVKEQTRNLGLQGTRILQGYLYHGMSGGGIFNSEDELVGIVSATRPKEDNLSSSREIKDTVVCNPRFKNIR